jgi:hypothetical protein
MGIRFYCPNGHKLNVKDFQAGRTGICPFCGVKMPIPLKSTRSSSRQRRRLQQGGGAAGVTASGAMARPAGWPASDTPRGMADDPLAAAEDVVWYVHPPAGGQFGPAAPDVMRAWIVEGRIGADSLVWREGWREWQTAGDVFPQLSPPAPLHDEESQLPSFPISPLRAGVIPDYRRTRVKVAQIVFIALLTLAVAALFLTLHAVFKQ